MKHQPFMAILAGSAALLITGATLGMTQPQNRAGNGPQQKAADRGGDDDRPQGPRKKVLEIRIDADALRARLNRSILRAEQMLERNKAALTKLDEGASPTEVLAGMRFEGIARNPMNDQRDALQRKPGEGQSPSTERMNPKDRKKMHAFIQENFPELWGNLHQIVEQDPRMGDRLLARMSPQIREILILQESQPELAKIKIEEMQIGLAFVDASRVFRGIMNNSSATESQRTEAMAQVRELAAKRFDVQLKSKIFEIDRLEERLNQLKASVDDIEQRRDVEIDRMVNSTGRNARQRGENQSRDRSRNRTRNPDQANQDQSGDD